MADAPFEIASTIQSTHIQRAPSPHHDLNPSTAASDKIPVEIRTPTEPPSSPSVIPLRPRPRKPVMPPLPDLRFEQSYLASIPQDASYGVVAYITIRDQILMPLVQGMAWTLILSGWRFWNRETNLKGRSLGAKVRRWWWNVNNWKLPEDISEAKAEGVQEYYQAQASSGGD